MIKQMIHHLLACGKEGLPDSIRVDEKDYRLQKVFKHDFFAGTGLYICENSDGNGENHNGHKVVLKLGRQQSFLGVPMAWLGRMLCRREVENLSRLRDIGNTPVVLSRFGKNGFVYEYIDGKTLAENPELADDFFEKLSKLLDKIHQADMVYLDLNKRDNIIVGEDGEAYLIDFQISVHIDDSKLFGKFWRKVRLSLQREDRYHLCKHKRKFSPEVLADHEREIAIRPSFLIRMHRFIANPFRKVRRAFLASSLINRALAVYRNKNRQED